MVFTTVVWLGSFFTYYKRIKFKDSSLSFPSCKQFFVISKTFKCWEESHSTIHYPRSPFLRQASTHSRLPGAPSRFYNQVRTSYSTTLSYSSICRYLITGQTSQKSPTEAHSRGPPQRERRTAVAAVGSRWERSRAESGRSSAMRWDSRARQAVDKRRVELLRWTVMSAQGSSWNCSSSLSSVLRLIFSLRVMAPIIIRYKQGQILTDSWRLLYHYNQFD